MTEEDYSIDEWDGELNLEAEKPLYKELKEKYNPFDSGIYDKVKEKTLEYQKDLYALSSFPIHAAMEEYTNIFQPGNSMAPIIDNAFHFTLAYGITGALYDGMNELESLAERKGWGRVEEHLSKDGNKIRWVFGVLNLLGTGKEFLDSSIDPGDVVFNNIGFLARTKVEFGLEKEDIIEEYIPGDLPKKLIERKIK